jgi:hypothetical protein
MLSSSNESGRLLLMGSSAYNTRELHSKVKERLDDAIDLDMEIVVGEAKGASRAFQDYLAFRNYKKVTVGHARSIRYNAGNWNTRKYGDNLKERELNMIKDCATAIIIWVNQSSVIAENLENLKRYGKPTLLHEVDTEKGIERIGELDPRRIYSRYMISKQFYKKPKG